MNFWTGLAAGAGIVAVIGGGIFLKWIFSWEWPG